MANRKISLKELKALVKSQLHREGFNLKENEGQGNLTYEDLVDLYEEKIENERLSVKNYIENWFEKLFENISWTIGCIGDAENDLQELAQEVSKGNYLKEDYERCKNDLDKEKQKLSEIISDMDALDLLDRIGDIRGNEWRTGEGYLGNIYKEANSLQRRLESEVEYARGR